MANVVVPSTSTGIVSIVGLLNKDNYTNWSQVVRTYLKAQDLWDVVKHERPKNTKQIKKIKGDPAPKPEICVEGESAPKPTDNIITDDESSDTNLDQEDQIDNAKEDIKTWKKKNAAALHVIRTSCDLEAISMIIESKKAKDAWGTLETKFDPEFRHSSGGPGETDDIPAKYQSIYKDIVRDDCKAVKELIEKDHDAVTAKISEWGDTALHIAAAYGVVDVVKNLVEQMDEEELEKKNGDGETALVPAAMSGRVEIAKCLIEKNRKLAQIPDKEGTLPVVDAVLVGRSDMVDFLYRHTFPKDTEIVDKSNGADLLFYCILSRNFDIAFDLIERCPELTITICTEFGSSSLDAMAMCSSETFPSGSHLKFWQNWIYNYILKQPTPATSSDTQSGSNNEIRIKIRKMFVKEQDGGIEKDSAFMIPGLPRAIASYIFEFPGIKQIYDLKLAHLGYQELLQSILEILKHLRGEKGQQVLDVAYNAMLAAVKAGHLELVMEIAKTFPELIQRSDPKPHSLFSYAVEFRQAEIFSLVHGLVSLKEEIALYLDDTGNTVTHLAGQLAPPSYLSRISGAALQMQRELQWFKEVDSILENQKNKNYTKNYKNMTAREFFSENHKELARQGEKWMKGIASSCIFVAALIVTIMFAAAFIVPGGDAHEEKLSTISHEKWFLLYIISDAISLFSSTTSVLMFLGILTSRYYQEAFLRSLPTKLIIGLSALFFSIATMMISFCSALYGMLQGQLTIIIPVILLASVPVTLFVKLQFPLLVEIFCSTYGPGIFTRKYKNWLKE